MRHKEEDNEKNNRWVLIIYALVVVTCIILKLTGAVNWSWLFVISPVLIPIALVSLMVAVIIVSEMTKDKVKTKSEARKAKKERDRARLSEKQQNGGENDSL